MKITKMVMVDDGVENHNFRNTSPLLYLYTTHIPKIVVG